MDGAALCGTDVEGRSAPTFTSAVGTFRSQALCPCAVLKSSCWRGQRRAALYGSKSRGGKRLVGTIRARTPREEVYSRYCCAHLSYRFDAVRSCSVVCSRQSYAREKKNEPPCWHCWCSLIVVKVARTALRCRFEYCTGLASKAPTAPTAPPPPGLEGSMSCCSMLCAIVLYDYCIADSGFACLGKRILADPGPTSVVRLRYSYPVLDCVIVAALYLYLYLFCCLHRTCLVCRAWSCRGAGVEFGSFNILTDEDVRAGLKVYSKLSTFPQVKRVNRVGNSWACTVEL